MKGGAAQAAQLVLDFVRRFYLVFLVVTQLNGGGGNNSLVKNKEI